MTSASEDPVTEPAASERDRGEVPFARFEQRLVPLLHGFDGVIYVLIGVVFLLAALGMLVYSVLSFAENDRAVGFPLAVVDLINDLLLVMIILEVLRTVLSYLDQRGSSLQPFLFIGIISATRRILAIGAQMTVTGETLSPELFQRSMIDLGANAGAILAISVALYLIRRHAPEAE